MTRKFVFLFVTKTRFNSSNTTYMARKHFKLRFFLCAVVPRPLTLLWNRKLKQGGNTLGHQNGGKFRCDLIEDPFPNHPPLIAFPLFEDVHRLHFKSLRNTSNGRDYQIQLSEHLLSPRNCCSTASTATVLLHCLLISER